MRTLATKQHILADAGYVYNFDRQIYFNRKAKNAFSVEFVEDNDEEILEQCIRQETDGKWVFHFNSPPAEAVRRELEIVLG